MNQPKNEMEMFFLGSGNAFSAELGNSSAVLMKNKQPQLMIDCGLTALHTYQENFDGLPPALFLTHCHFDHIGSLEMLLYANHFKINPNQNPNQSSKQKTKLFCPASIIPEIHNIMGSFPNFDAEGGVNVWESVQLIPVSQGFWLDNLYFNVFSGRHHYPQTSFGLSLQGHFLFSGDTRPIPEVIMQYASQDDIIFHDCSFNSNTSHSGIDDIEREYRNCYKNNMVLYHLDSFEHIENLEQNGYKVANPLQHFKV